MCPSEFVKHSYAWLTSPSGRVAPYEHTREKGVHTMRRTILLTAIVAVIAASAALAKSFPPTIALPNGWQPEGIAVGDGSTFYVGSIPTGAVYRGDLRTGKGATLVP